MKRFVAVFFASVIATVMLLGLLWIGLSAWTNTSSVPPSNSPSAMVSPIDPPHAQARVADAYPILRSTPLPVVLGGWLVG